MFGFRKKVTLEMPDGNGGTKKVRVSQEQLDRWVAEGLVSKVQSCTVHCLDPDRGEYTESWEIGREIPLNKYDELKDSNGELFLLTVYEDGKPRSSVVPKQYWSMAKAQFAEIDTESRRFRKSSEKMLRRLRDLP